MVEDWENTQRRIVSAGSDVLLFARHEYLVHDGNLDLGDWIHPSLG